MIRWLREDFPLSPAVRYHLGIDFAEFAADDLFAPPERDPEPAPQPAPDAPSLFPEEELEPAPDAPEPERQRAALPSR